MPSAAPDAPPPPGGDHLDAPPPAETADDLPEAAPDEQPAPAPDEASSGTLPDRFADGTMRKLEPGIRTIWMLKLGGLLLLPVLAVLFYAVVQWFGGTGGAFWIAGGLFVVCAVVAVGLPMLRYRFWRYALRPEELYLERGVFNRVRTIVPLRRIQHLDVSQDLFEREFDLGKLIVHTAGGRSSDVAVPGLRYETAERLRDDVKHYVLDDAV